VAKFPEFADVNYDFPITIEFQTKTLISQFDDEDAPGREKRRQKWTVPRRNIKIPYSKKFFTADKIDTIWKFFLARGGKYETFSFYLDAPFIQASNYGQKDYDGEYVGTGDGSATQYSLPGRSVSNETVYKGVTPLPTSGEYWIDPQAGSDNEDVLFFSVAPSQGERVTIDFTGILKIRCRFMHDALSVDDFHNIVARTGVELKGLMNDE
jgi:hypothetical protein